MEVRRLRIPSYSRKNETYEKVEPYTIAEGYLDCAKWKMNGWREAIPKIGHLGYIAYPKHASRWPGVLAATLAAAGKTQREIDSYNESKTTAEIFLNVFASAPT